MSGKIYLPLFLLFISLIPLISSSVIGLDFGSEFLKASTIQPGKLFSIVEDTTTKRKTPSAISFCNNERIFEWDTIAKRPKCYTNTFWYLPKFLGKSPNDPHLAELSKAYFEDYKLIENDRGLINLGIKPFKFDEEDTVSEIRLEDALGMIFSHVKDHAEAQAERQLRDIVVTIPPWWGFKERYALQDACLIAGLNPLGFVHENTAAALYYALEREDNVTFNVIFYNIGSGGLKVSLIEYKLENSTEKYEKGKQYESFKVLAEAWDDTVSGQAIDNNIVRHLASVFDALPARKGKKSVLQSPTAISKLYKESQKVKETLSANKFVNIYMEGLFESTDLKLQIDRPTFEDINKELFTKLTPPIQRVLDRAGKTFADINEIELIGGAVRVPKIQQILAEFAGREVSQHLNGDESMALGAAFYAANLSSSFKTRTIYLNDGYNFDIRVELRDLEAPLEGQAPLEKAATLFPYKTRYGSKKTLAFSHDRDFQATFFASVDGNDEDWILRFNVTGFDKISENPKYKDLGLPKVSLLFQLNALGFVELKKAEATLEETIMVEEKVNKTSNKTAKNSTKDTKTETPEEPEAAEKETEGEKKEETDETKKEEEPKTEDPTSTKNEAESEPEKKYKKKVVTHTITLTVTTVLPGAGSLSTDEIEKGIALLDKFDDFEEAKRKLSESKNRLESFIYRCRELVEEGPFVECSKQEEREQLSALTEQNGEWLNGDEAYTAKYKEFDQRYTEMAQIVERVVKRIDQKAKRPELIERSRAALTNFTERATEINTTRPWIHENLTNPIFKQIDEARTWLEDLIEKQSALGDNDDPILIDTNVIAKLDRIKDKIISVRSTPKPKPPKAKNGTKPDVGGGFKFDGTNFDEEAFKEYMKQNGNKFNDDFAKAQQEKKENGEGQEEGQQNAGGDEQSGNNDNANTNNANTEENVSDKNENEKPEKETPKNEDL